MPSTAPQTISQLMRAGDRFTDRDFMRVLEIGHPTLKRMEANPALFTLAHLSLLAGMLGKPTMLLARLVVEALGCNPVNKVQLAAALSKVTGRKNAMPGRTRGL